MKKIWKKIRGKDRTGEYSPKSGSTRGSVSSLNVSFEVKEKELGKLHKAVWYRDLNKVKQLAKKDPSPLDKENRTPLHLACVRGYSEIVQELLEWKAKANVGDNHSRTPLMRAVEFQHEECVQLLLEYHVEIDTVDKDGISALHLAVGNNHLKVITLLIKAGASLNVRDMAGYAPLHLAVINKFEDACHILLRGKADVNITDATSKTPLIMACSVGSISLVKLLLEYKADVTLKDNKGWSADDHAEIQSHHACSQLIADYTMKGQTPVSTPRSLSQPGSSLTTPREQVALGLPVADGGGDDSDNETISKVSGAPGSNSWADSDVSVGEEVKKKPGGPKINVAKFASSIHISESDTDGESIPNSTPRRKISVVGNPMGDCQMSYSGKPELNQQVSQNEDPWHDDQVTPRRSNSMKGVSFKKDEELSEIHDITNTESEGEDFYTAVDKSKPLGLASSTPAKSDLVASGGYEPSGVGPRASASLEKMRGSEKSAFLEDLGISDVDDISEVSEGAGQPPPLPASPPPAVPGTQRKQFDDWDSSLSTPRPGILKKPINSILNESIQNIQANVQKEVDMNVESDDDSSGWDSTETAPSKPELKPSLPAALKKNSVSEWDSDIEDMANPQAIDYLANPPTIDYLANPPTAASNDSFNGQVFINNSNETVDFRDAFTVELNFANSLEKELEQVPTKTVGQPMNESNDKESTASSSDWDSEAEDLPSGDKTTTAYIPTEPPPAPSSPKVKVQNQDITKSEDAEEESESVSSWELERKKQKQLQMAGPNMEEALPWGIEPDNELEIMLREKQEEQIWIQRQEEEERLLKERAEKERLTIQKEAEEHYRKKLKEEEDKLRQREEEERLRRQKEDEERIKRQKEEEERIRRQKEEEERIKRQKEEEERIRRQKEEEERIKRQKEEEERIRRQKEEEERITRQKEEEERKVEETERIRKQEEEVEDIYIQKKQLLNARFELDTEKREENNNLEWEREEMERQAELEEAWELEEFKKQEILRKTVDEKFDQQIANSTSAPLDLMTAVVDYDRKQPLSNADTPPHYRPVPFKSPKGIKSQGLLNTYTSSTSSSAVDEIKQRLQVTSSLSPAQFQQVSSEMNEDDESQLSDNAGDDRVKLPVSYYPGMYRPNDPLDDDALSYTSTEVEDNSYTTVSYWKDREFFSNINLEDPTALLRVQEYVRDARRLFEQEKNQRVVFENKLKVAANEKSEILRKLQNNNQEKSDLEQKNLVLSQEIRSLQLQISNEQEERQNAQVLLTKTKEQLERKESQFSSELEAKQSAELEMRNLLNDLRSAKNSIQELKKEKEELERQMEHISNARDAQKKMNDDQQKLILQLQHTTRESSSLESSLDSTGRLDKHNPELYALQMELDQQRRRFKDELAMLAGENEELAARNEELKNSYKLSEDALDQSAIHYNRQLANLDKEISSVQSALEREHASKEKLELEIESFKTRLLTSNQEMEKAISARNEMERDHKRDKETWLNELERKERELKENKEENQNLSQLLHNTEARLNVIENELHVSNTSLTERSSQYQLMKHELDRQIAAQQTLDQNYRQEKELNIKLQTKIETLQERLNTQQQETFSFKQQLDLLKLNSGHTQGTDSQDKLNSLLASLTLDNDRAKASLQEKNSSLIEQAARLKEEVKAAELRRSSLEQDLKHLQEEHNSLVKKLSQTDASLQIALKAKEQAEQERMSLKSELDRLQHKYQETHDKSVESQARISELVDRLEKAESTSLLSHQHLANTSANMQGLVISKSQLDETMQQLQIENTKLEAELKYEKQRADMLNQDLQDSMKVRSSLEALCANLKSSSAHLEDRLGEEIAAKSLYEAEAREHKDLYDLEMKSRSKLGRRIADLERNKGEEMTRANLADEKLRHLELQLEFEKEKNQKLQKDVTTLKLHLKSAKNKMKEEGGLSPHDPDYTEFQTDVFTKETFVSTPRDQIHAKENIDDIKTQLEAKYRKELNRKLSDVNKFLESQSQLRERLDTSRADLETNLVFDKRKLEEEMNNLRIKYEQAVAQRETKEMEAKRFRELYESEMKWRIRVSDQLQLATEKSFSLQSKLTNERHHRNRLTGSIGNLNSSVLSNNGFEFSRVNGFHDDELSSKIQAELDRSIAKHLEAAPHDYKKAFVRPTSETDRFTSSLTQSSSDYFEILKRKYCV
ncbi:trichohyalin-like isoform X3 [Biomphalaria glabrata]|uniref:Trichohyalin-like isoform X3 n=1 Tax=Biomphalaria glabrata TaxID=6526 RepID=A0A9W3A5D3_BIOGL|nr:trichohyalin-like isoform X3 [Biomphalaria glabrata]